MQETESRTLDLEYNTLGALSLDGQRRSLLQRPASRPCCVTWQRPQQATGRPTSAGYVSAADSLLAAHSPHAAVAGDVFEHAAAPLWL